MNRHATLVHHRAWRLILTVATGNEDARRTLASEVGEDADAWYQIANIAALQVAQLLDAEYMAAEAMSSFADNPDLGPPRNRRGGHRADRSRPRHGVRRPRHNRPRAGLHHRQD